MTYEEALNLAYAQLPVFHRDGRSALRLGLTNTANFCEYIGNPQNRFRSIHIAGTNGKGSTSHMLAAILQCAGYKVGLYTSPHLKNFTERIRVNGVEMDRQRVADFIERHQDNFIRFGLSFFELTVGMAFEEFARQKVDVAVIETGLGGLLDSTNVIQPVLSIITNVSYDHMDILGSSLSEIAAQKAGIIKYRTPIVVSQADQTIADVFRKEADRVDAPFFLANLRFQVIKYFSHKGLLRLFVQDQDSHNLQKTFSLELNGLYQRFNLPGVLQATEELKKQGFMISMEDIDLGLSQTVALTGLKGRWQKIGIDPLTYCDTGHNEAGVAAILECIRATPHAQLRIIFGCVRDKDVTKLIQKLPPIAMYIFSQASSPRAFPSSELQELAKAYDLHGISIQNVNEALTYARAQAHPNDLIVVCGSTYLVSELQNI